MNYFALTGLGKEDVGVIRYNAQKESTQIWLDGEWVTNNSLYSYMMEEGGAEPISETRADSIIESLKKKE